MAKKYENMIQEIVLDSGEIREVFLCLKCFNPILNDDDGFVVQGNIYNANITNKGGLIGNAFPKNSFYAISPFKIDEVKKYSYCRDCFFLVLNCKA